jgi:phage terminase small subunit
MRKKEKLILPKNGADLINTICETYDIRDGAGLILAQQAAQALDTALAAEKLIKKHGMIVEGERGFRANPACNISRDARNRLLAALGKLNLEL